MFCHTVQCENPTAPVNGDFDTVTSRFEGSIVTFECDPGYMSTEEMSTMCMADMTWSPDPSSFVCSPIVTIPPPVDCGIPDPPVNGSLLGSINTTEDSMIFYRCNEGLFPMGNLPSVCGGNGVWKPNPRDQCCVTEQCKFDFEFFSNVETCNENIRIVSLLCT